MKLNIKEYDLNENNENGTTTMFDINDNFKFNKTFSDIKKLEKFDNMCEEYTRLMNYRQMLYVMVTQNRISYQEYEGGIIVQKTKTLSSNNVVSINNEIKSLNSIISWIETFILDEPNLTKIKEKDENAGADTEKD